MGRVLVGLVLGAVLQPATVRPGGAQESAQELMRAVERAPEGEVRIRFPTEDGVVVCDDGSLMTGDGDRMYWGRNRSDRICQEGEAQITMGVRGGEVRRVSRPEPASAPAGGTDLGLVSGPEAGALFLLLARRTPDRVAERALLPAVVARDATVWPGFLELARDRSRSSDLRRKVVFWLGQEAAAAVNPELVAMAEDDSEASKVRDAAIFALSQRPDDEGVPALMKLVRDSRDPRVRKKAIFWLAQSRDPRVVPFFEEILLERGGG